MRRCWDWLAARRVTSGDWLQGGLLIWFAIALSRASAAQRAAVPLYQRMEHIAPFWAWVALPLVFAAAMLVCIFARRARLLGWVMLGVALWWVTWSWLLWSVSSTYLTPAFPAIAAVSAILRQTELRLPRP